MKKKKGFFKRIMSPTPKKWKERAKLIGGLTAVIAASYGAVSVLNLPMPNWFAEYVGYAVFIFTFIGGAITLYAAQHEVKSKENE